MRDSEVSLCIKYLLFFFNVLFWITGGIICYIGLWARVALSSENTSLGLLSGWDFDPAIIFIFVGAVMFLLAFCGCVGALRENICLLKFFAICLSTIFFVQLALGTLGFVFRRKIKKLVSEKLSDTIMHYRSNVNLQNIIDYSQETFQCCGLNTHADWKRNVYFNCTQRGREACSVPYSCCRTDTLNTMCGANMNSDTVTDEQRQLAIYTDGCIDGIARWFQDHLQVVAGVAIGVAVLQVIGIAFAATLISDIRRQLAKWQSPHGMHQPLYLNEM